MEGSDTDRSWGYGWREGKFDRKRDSKIIEPPAPVSRPRGVAYYVLYSCGYLTQSSFFCEKQGRQEASDKVGPMGQNTNPI